MRFICGVLSENGSLQHSDLSMRVYLRGLAEQSEIRVSGPLRRDHYRGDPVFFSAGSVTRYAASSKFAKNRPSYATSVRLSCPLSRFKSRTRNDLKLLFEAVA